MRRAILIFRCETQPCVISIHALHEESDLVDVIIDTIVKISIHALHEESDSHIATVDGGDLPISIHALHEESDSMSCTCVPVRVRFQSTLSMRRAINISVPLIIATSISIHALHEESDSIRDNHQRQFHISIHALHEESDSAAGHFCPLFETQASCLALSISNNTADTTNNMSKTSNWLSVSF